MKKVEMKSGNFVTDQINESERGSAIVIALFVLILISAFVALAMSRTTSEAAAIGSETSEARTTYAAQGSLEMMTRNFNKLFEVKLNPSPADIVNIQNASLPAPLNTLYAPPVQTVERVSDSVPTVLSDGPYKGLYAIRDNWQLQTEVTDSQSNVQVELTRNILNNRIPIFQFGVFYDDDMELHNPPRFSFGGRVHSNRNFFLSPGTDGVYFNSKITAHGQIITQTLRNGAIPSASLNQTFINNAAGVPKQLLPTQGSVLNTTNPAENIFANPAASDIIDPDLPMSKFNPTWTADSAKFDGNLLSKAPLLKLPLTIGNTADLIEMIKRGKAVGDLAAPTPTGGIPAIPVTATNVDNEVFRTERFANKTGIRISLADSKAKLPGCASGTGVDPVAGRCGVRLDGDIDGLGGEPTPITSPLPADVSPFSRGYKPIGMKLTTTSSSIDYIPTRVNGERLFTGGTREIWVKVETVQTNSVTQAIETKDITEDFLSLGVTEQAPNIQNSGTKFRIDPSTYNDTPPNNDSSLGSPLNQTTSQPPSQGTDSRSIFKIQRFAINGPTIPGGNNYLKSYPTNGGYNAVVRFNITDPANPDPKATLAGGCSADCTGLNEAPTKPDGTLNYERFGHLKLATVDGVDNRVIVPFPIEMFDTREGTFFDAPIAANAITKMGVMSMVDIDVANLRRFLRGDFNGLLPATTPFAISNGNVGLKNTDIPSRNGWVVYVSDRRGDRDFDGEFDMEDVYRSAPNVNDSNPTNGEDVNKNGVLDVDSSGSGSEAPADYADTIPADNAAVVDHRYYRRGVRLINGTVLPGIYDAVNSSNTKGFTVASENAIYVKGNYNATDITGLPSTGNTPYSGYLPFNTPTHIPASIVSDATVILSNSWNDAESFAFPYNKDNRQATTTQMRFAMISGDTISNLNYSPNQGGSNPHGNGGIHNFKRFLERWQSPIRLDFSGSLINLYNSHNNNGSYKCCSVVYSPPLRNWVFDSTFLDPQRLPPGTPYFQYVQTTGFLRTND